MAVALQVTGIVLFALLIVGSIALHEVGHLVPAKRFGVRVPQYMIGFGPTIWSRRRGETEYGFKAIPLGGYIRMIGMIPPARGDESGTVRSGSTGRLAALIDSAREDAAVELQPGDEKRLFYKLPVRKRMVIMLGGPVMNLVLAFLLFTIVLVGIGLPTGTTQVAATVPCVPTVSAPSGAANAAGTCPDGASPAARAGLLPGDRIVAIDGWQPASWSEVSTWIRSHAGVTAVMTVERGGQPVSLPVTVASVARPVIDETGRDTGRTETVGYLGMRPAVDYVAQPISAVPSRMWELTVGSVKALISLPVRLWELLTGTLIGGGERAIDGPVSVVGVTRLGGDIAASDEPFEGKAATFLSLAAGLNLFLFLFNLLPILPLDGGHVAGAAYEGARRRIAKWRGRPDPGPFDIARLMPVTYAVAALLFAMSLIVIWADIVKPISLG